jgi:hypothetical protein
MRTGMLVAALAAMTLVGSPEVRGQAAKEKEQEKDKEKATGKAKPPARSFTDEDLKKYKEKPKDGSSATQAGSSGQASEPEAQPNQRRSRESGGGYRDLPQPPPRSAEEKDQANEPEPAATEAKSPEEAEWRSRATLARRPLDEAQGRIKDIESQMASLRDQLNPMSTTYVLGGNSTAGPGQVYEIEEKLRNLESEMVEAKTGLADAEKSWQSFLDEARSAGISPAWLKP